MCVTVLCAIVKGGSYANFLTFRCVYALLLLLLLFDRLGSVFVNQRIKAVADREKAFENRAPKRWMLEPIGEWPLLSTST